MKKLTIYMMGLMMFTLYIFDVITDRTFLSFAIVVFNLGLLIIIFIRSFINNDRPIWIIIISLVIFVIMSIIFLLVYSNINYNDNFALGILLISLLYILVGLLMIAIFYFVIRSIINNSQNVYGGYILWGIYVLFFLLHICLKYLPIHMFQSQLIYFLHYLCL